MKRLIIPFSMSLVVHVGLTFANTTTTNLTFVPKNVSFWATVRYTKDINISMFLLIECISLGCHL
jgi:hypothetical protein